MFWVHWKLWLGVNEVEGAIVEAVIVEGIIVAGAIVEGVLGALAGCS